MEAFLPMVLKMLLQTAGPDLEKLLREKFFPQVPEDKVGDALASSLDANGTKWVQAALNVIDGAKLNAMANTDLPRAPPSRNSSARMGSRSTVGPASTPTTCSGPSCSKPRDVGGQSTGLSFARMIASERALTRIRLTAQVASKLNQLRDTNLRPR